MSRTYRSKKQARTYWQEVLKRWQQSDLSVHRFCQTQRISESGFYSWRKKLSATPSADTQTGNPKSPFVQVDMALATQSPMTLQLAGGHRLQIANQVDANTLVKVLGALREAKLC